MAAVTPDPIVLKPVFSQAARNDFALTADHGDFCLSKQLVVELGAGSRPGRSSDLIEPTDISRKMRVSLLHMGDDTRTLDVADWRLEPISGADREVVEVICLPPEQEEFAGSLDEVFGRLNESAAVGLEQGFAVIEPSGEIVGFFVLREGLRRPAWAPPGTVSLHSFRVRPGFQGKGVGRRCIALLEEWFARERPVQPQLMLAVNARNTPAIAAYQKIGFIDTGSRHEEGHGPQFIFVKPMG